MTESNFPQRIKLTANKLDSTTVRGILDALHECPAVLVRGLKFADAQEFSRICSHFIEQPIHYNDRVTPRRQLDDTVYSSTDAPASYRIGLHSEATFSQTFPSRLVFGCITPAENGGQTPICRTRNVLKRMDQSLLDKLLAKGVCYQRNFSRGPGMDWKTTFQLQTAAELDDYCLRNDIEFEWLDRDHLRTRQYRPALARCPDTGKLVWFNHIGVLHIHSQSAALRSLLTRQYPPDMLPQNVLYGDLTEIADNDVAHIVESYQAETTLVEWQPNDLLLLDNLRTAHGREPYQGHRQILVSMGNPLSWPDVSTRS